MWGVWFENETGWSIGYLLVCFVLFVALCYGNVSSVQERSPSVIVIGGGMAGIAAARALQDASFQVFELNILI